MIMATARMETATKTTTEVQAKMMTGLRILTATARIAKAPMALTLILGYYLT
jgi:hypothetical protein